ncbi:hypothetical protein D7V93_04685 [Corallococcus llansteffanensis]|uniref:Uncharacterized protein n=1 Tax=Corallococcus llansteffanensis TaxID=2316731 RepID=A0A3A8QCD9_9BACT|nr:hypothetical protein D7V93_04685 [Corallococcus llansteffanensis]
MLTLQPTAQAVAAATERLPEPTTAVRDTLRRTLAASLRAPVSGQWPALLLEARAKADVRYVEPATSHRPLVGPVLVFAKRTFRGAFQPFINEVLRRQVHFNEAILDALTVVIENQREHARSQALWRRELEARVKQLEKDDQGPSSH